MANLKQASGSLLGSVASLGLSLSQTFDLVNDGIGYASAAVRQLKQEQAVNHVASTLTHKRERMQEVTQLLADLDIDKENYRSISKTHAAAWDKAEAEVNEAFANI